MADTKFSPSQPAYFSDQHTNNNRQYPLYKEHLFQVVLSSLSTSYSISTWVMATGWRVSIDMVRLDAVISDALTTKRKRVDWKT